MLCVSGWYDACYDVVILVAAAAVCFPALLFCFFTVFSICFVGGVYVYLMFAGPTSKTGRVRKSANPDAEVVEIISSDDEDNDNGVLDMVVVDAVVSQQLGIAAPVTSSGVAAAVVRSTQKRGVPWDNPAANAPQKHRKGGS